MNDFSRLRMQLLPVEIQLASAFERAEELRWQMAPIAEMLEKAYQQRDAARQQMADVAETIQSASDQMKMALKPAEPIRRSFDRIDRMRQNALDSGFRLDITPLD